ncbi:hypothetical protein HY991_03440 [Candidatus Micrarchaeota archaeon]|nr:hypothetical protein [Candidatus Micrarchaeota archaeon]
MNQRTAVEAAFENALKKVGERTYERPGAIASLLKKEHPGQPWRNITLANHGLVSFESAGAHLDFEKGTLLFVKHNEPAAEADKMFGASFLKRKNQSVMLKPRFLTSDDSWKRKNAFGHIVVLGEGNKAVLLVASLQKITSASTRFGRPVDHFTKTHGPDRHYAFLDYAMEIADAMRAQGIETEVHIPQPESIDFAKTAVGKGTLERIRAPFEKLRGHFRKSTVSIGGRKIGTINLSEKMR